MGVEKTYEGDRNVGLLGYSHGRQSIFLDAETGDATFGLPEEQSDKNDPLTEGRIELRPGGTSKIGNWKIGSDFLYNVVAPSREDEDYDPQKSIDVGPGNKTTYLRRIIGEEKYEEYDVDIGHVRDVPHESQGLMLYSNPSYISVKGRKLTSADIDDNANRVVSEGDALEVQLDPAQQSLFSIFRHYPARDDNGDIIYDDEGRKV